MSAPLRCLTVRQPWAWAITFGGKRIENRTRTTAHRGPVAIHAGLAWDKIGGRDPRVWDAWTNWARTIPLGPDRPPGYDGPTGFPGMLRKECGWIDFGAIIAVVDLVDVCAASIPLGLKTCDCGRWAEPDQAHWRLDNVRPLRRPVPCRGALGLWKASEDVASAVWAQLEVAA